jgi:hypothetical protein
MNQFKNIAEYVEAFLSNHGEKMLVEAWEISWGCQLGILQLPKTRKRTMSHADINNFVHIFFYNHLEWTEHDPNKLEEDWESIWSQQYPDPPLL